MKSYLFVTEDFKYKDDSGCGRIPVVLLNLFCIFFWFSPQWTVYILRNLRSFIFSVSDDWEYHGQLLEASYVLLAPFSWCERTGNGGSVVAD